MTCARRALLDGRFAALAVAVALALAGCWWWEAFGARAPGDAAATSAASDAQPASVATAGPTAPASDATAAAVVHDERVAAPAAPERPTLRVRLCGLHPDVPWRALLVLGLEGFVLRHTAQAVPGADGCAVFSVPAFAVHSLRRGRIQADAPGYLPLFDDWEGAIDLGQERVLDVQVVATVTGRVRDVRGAAVANALITAFVGAGRDRPVGEAKSGADGSFGIAVPPNTPLQLLAEPLCNDVLAVDAKRGGLLPAIQSVTGVLGAACEVPDFVLADAATILGVVRWSDGSPIPGTRIVLRPHGDAGVPAANRLVTTRSDRQGAFGLPAIAGQPTGVELLSLPVDLAHGDAFAADVVPPNRVEFAVPLPITLLMRCEGTSLQGTRTKVELEDGRAYSCARNGVFSLLLREPTLRIRASGGGARSPWLSVSREQAGETVEVELRPELGEVAIEFAGARDVGTVGIGWRRDDGATGHERLPGAGQGACRLFLEPGHYHLQIGRAGGEHVGGYLLTSEHDVDVTDVPLRLALSPVFGGRLEVDVRDANGLRVAGACRVVDATNREVSAPFRVRLDEDRGSRFAAPGELLTCGVNVLYRVLPPGDYVLDFDVPGYGHRRRSVAIAEQATARVVVRLP